MYKRTKYFFLSNVIATSLVMVTFLLFSNTTYADPHFNEEGHKVLAQKFLENYKVKNQLIDF